MNDEKWENLITSIDEKFGIEEKKTEEDNLVDDVGKTYEGTRDIIIFNGIQGRMKIERVNHPVIEDKKMHYHKGTGGTAQVEYNVSETERTHRVTAYSFNEATEDWEELKLPGGTMSF